MVYQQTAPSQGRPAREGEKKRPELIEIMKPVLATPSAAGDLQKRIGKSTHFFQAAQKISPECSGSPGGAEPGLQNQGTLLLARAQTGPKSNVGALAERDRSEPSIRASTKEAKAPLGNQANQQKMDKGGLNDKTGALDPKFVAE